MNEKVDIMIRVWKETEMGVDSVYPLLSLYSVLSNGTPRSVASSGVCGDAGLGIGIELFPTDRHRRGGESDIAGQLLAYIRRVNATWK